MIATQLQDYIMVFQMRVLVQLGNSSAETILAYILTPAVDAEFVSCLVYFTYGAKRSQ